MSTHDDEIRNDRSRFRVLDKVVPLLVVGVAVYVAGRAIAGLRDAERRLAERNGGTWYPLAPPVDHTDMWPREKRRESYRVSTTKKLLMLAMLISILAYIMGDSTFATFSAQTTNRGSSISSGTLTLSDQVNSGTVCNSYNSSSQDNYNPACAIVLNLQNQAPGVTDTSGTYIGGYAKLTLANTGSLNASLFSFFAPWVGGTLATQINNGANVTSMTTSALEGPVANTDAIVLNFGAVTQQFCASASSAAGSTSITIGSSYTPGNTGSCPATGINSSTPAVAGTTFQVGTRVNDTSSDTITTNTDCYDQVTTTTTVPGATTGNQLNFNSGSLCQNAVLWIQEQSVVGSNTYDFCWFGSGSNSTGNTEDTYGACRTPTQISMGNTITAGSPISSSPNTATTTLNGAINNSTTSVVVSSNAGQLFSNGDTVIIDNEEMTISSGASSNGTSWTVTRAANGTTAASHSNSATVTKVNYNLSAGTLHGNIDNGDHITLVEGGNTMTCQSAATYYIGNSGNVAVTSCGNSSPTTGQVYDNTASDVVQDSDAFTALNGSNPQNTISNFDTSHPPSHPIYMAPLTANATRNLSATVQLAAHGDANSKDIRTFYMGIYFPSPTGVNQNTLQGIMSTFGIGWHIDQ